MPGFLTAAAKATSTVCLIWSAYMLARTRPWRKLSTDSNEATEENHKSHPPTQNQQHKAEDRSNRGSSHTLELLSIDATSENSNAAADTNSSGSDMPAVQDRGALIRQSLMALYKLIHSSSHDVSSSPSTSKYTSGEENNQELDYFYKFIGTVAEEACMTVNTNHLAHSLSRKIRLPGLSRNSPMNSETLTRILIAYSKDPKFLDLLFDKPDTLNLISFLARCALHFVPPLNDSATQVSSTSSPSGNLDNSNWSDADSNLDSSMIDSNKSTEFGSTSTTTQISHPSLNDMCVDNHPEYPLHLYLATLVANLSRHSKSHTLGLIEDVNKLLDEWSNSPSLHLVLLSSKIRHNFEIFTRTNTEEDSNTDQPIVYYPDIYRLDMEKDLGQDWDFDVIFVNGMLGSVFYTWRQSESALTNEQVDNESPYTKCWPRDWLSSEFPNARIIGIDASLKPFIWNSICPMRKFRRSLDSRALDIMKQLQFAGIGRRPVIWVTHSAGGILVKEMLRLAKLGISNQPTPIFWESNIPTDTSSSTNTPLHDSTPHQFFEDDPETQHTDHTLLNESTTIPEPDHCPNTNRRRAHQSFILSSNVPENISPSSPAHHLVSQRSSVTLTRQRSLSSEFADTLDPGLSIEFEQLANQTKGIVFISVPHRGNQSLFALYRRPFRWALTPEAIQLERNSEYLLDLHVWFNMWSCRHHVQVLSMAETRLTPVNRFWSVLLVPEDSRDREMGSVVSIDADHLYISKPVTPSDLAYTSLVAFIHALPFLQPQDSSPPQSNC